jgi:Protein of unknown function (DUF669)
VNFTPLSDTDTKPVPPGTYYFKVTKAVEKVSSSGNTMIQLTLRISDGNGLERTITDHLLSTIRRAKLLGAAMACGLAEKYNIGCLVDEDFLHKSGRVKVDIEGPKNGYPERNIVIGYSAADTGS